MKGFDYFTTLIKEKVLKNYHYRPFDRFLKRHFKGEIIGAEIGVLEGFHAESMLHHLPIKKLYLIDPYINYEGYDCYTRMGLDHHFKVAKNKLDYYGNRKEFVKKKFQDALDDIPDNLDFIYYDISANTERIKQFFDLYYPKLKENGVIGGWNYIARHHEVPRAVFDIMDKYGLELHGDGSDWWMIKKTKTKTKSKK